MSSEREPLLPSSASDVSEDAEPEVRREAWTQLRGLVLLMAIALLATLLFGCTASSNFTRDLHILSLSYDTVSPAASSQQAPRGTLDAVFTDRIRDESNIKEIRVGYFGLCAVSNSGSFICSHRPLDIAESLKASGQTDPLNLLWLGNQLRAEAVSPALVLLSAAIFFTAYIASLIFSVSAKPKGPASSTIFSIFLNRPLSATAFIIAMFFAIASVFTAALWQTLASTSSSLLVKSLAFGAVACHPGPAAVTLGWTSVFLACCAFLTLFSSLGRSNTTSEQP